MSFRTKMCHSERKCVIPNENVSFRTCFGIFILIKEENSLAETGYVYFMTNKTNTVLYIGVTSDLQKRVLQHKIHQYEGFTDKYNCTKLVYFEECNDIKAAITREKQLKNWHRDWKNNLVNQFNKDWKDLAEE